MPSSTLREGP
ncbi:Protein of unknown function [Bacillus wiedmannii]|nr:Protein of unknown function [Bacillus wiedmannii]